MKRPRASVALPFFALLLAGPAAGPAAAQAVDAPDPIAAPDDTPPATPEAGGAALTLGEAIELALVKSFAVRVAREDLAIARGRIDEAWGSVYPKVDASARYTHTFESPSPFPSGEDPFGGLGTLLGATAGQVPANAWLAYNERQRQTQGDQAAVGFGEFLALCGAEMAPAECDAVDQIQAADTGSTGESDDNLFLIPDQINATLAITQVLYSGRAFTAIQAAEVFEAQQLENIRQQSITVVGDVARAYYRARLAQQQVTVTRKSVERLRQTLAEMTSRVEQGVLPPFQQLSTEVEVANLESRLVQAEAQAADAIDALELTIGLPPEQETRLSTPLSLPGEPVSVASLDEAMVVAERQRADLAQLETTRKLLATQVDLTRADYLPIVSAFANIGAVANIPADSDGGPFNGDYWGPSINAGINLSWNLFGGFSTNAQVAQQEAELRKLEVQVEQTRAGVRLELARVLRAVDSAKRRLDAQTRTVERAELNFEHAEARVQQGVSSPIELREASQQLDESRLNRLQAIHDLLVAWIDYEVAIGTAPADLRAVRMSPKEAP